MDKILNEHKSWRYKNTTLLILSLVLLYFVSKTTFVADLVRAIGEFGYVSAFVIGIFFVSVFTVAPSVIVLFYLASILNPIAVAVLAGAGAVIGDLLIFKFLRGGIFDELAPTFKKLGDSYLCRMFSTPYFSWLLPVLGAVIIVSPFPDEIGIGLLGLSKVKSWQFAIVSFLLNSAGIFVIVTMAK